VVHARQRPIGETHSTLGHGQRPEELVDLQADPPSDVPRLDHPIEQLADLPSPAANRRPARRAPPAGDDVRDFRLHDGRHTAATLLLSAGMHRRVVTTYVYSHVLPALGRGAADRMGNALWGPPAR